MRQAERIWTCSRRTCCIVLLTKLGHSATSRALVRLVRIATCILCCSMCSMHSYVRCNACAMVLCCRVRMLAWAQLSLVVVHSEHMLGLMRDCVCCTVQLLCGMHLLQQRPSRSQLVLQVTRRCEGQCSSRMPHLRLHCRGKMVATRSRLTLPQMSGALCHKPCVTTSVLPACDHISPLLQGVCLAHIRADNIHSQTLSSFECDL